MVNNKRNFQYAFYVDGQSGKAAGIQFYRGDVHVVESEERRNSGYDRTKIVMQIIKSNVRRKV